MKKALINHCVLVVILSLFIISCRNSNDTKLIGTWKCKYNSFCDEYLEIQKNGDNYSITSWNTIDGKQNGKKESRISSFDKGCFSPDFCYDENKKTIHKHIGDQNWGDFEKISNPISETGQNTKEITINNSNVSSPGRTIKIDNLEVMTKNLGKMSWSDAKKACESLGPGWRLPTKDELNTLYKNKIKIGGFEIVGDKTVTPAMNYWSSTMYQESSDYPIVLVQSFLDGSQSGQGGMEAYVRAVRTFSP